jgi:hypothetical protein
MSTLAFKPDPHSQLSPQKTPKTLRIIFIPWEQGSDEAKEWKDKSEQWNVAKPEKKFNIVYYNPNEKENAYLMAANANKESVIYIRGHGSPGANSLKANVLEEQRSLAMTDVCQRLIGMGLESSFPGAIKFHSCYSAVVYTDSSFEESHAAATAALKSSIERKAFLTTGLPGELKEVKDRLEQTRKDLEEEKNKWFWNRDDDKVAELTRAEDRRAKRVGDLEKQQLETPGADAYIRERELRVPTRESIARQGATYMRDRGFNHCTYFGYLGPMESLYALDMSSAEQKTMHKFVNVEHLADPPEEVGGLLKQDGVNPQAVRARTVRMKIM